MDTFGAIRILGLAALLTSASVQSAKIHEQMTDDEIANLFHTTRDNIPEYDVVPIRHNLYKRSNTALRIQFNAHGKKIDAFLDPSDGLLAGENTPVWLASSMPNGTVVYKKMSNDIVGRVARVYSNPTNHSTILLSKPEGRNIASFEGTVDGMVIRPLPARFQGAAKKKRNIEDSDASRTLLDSNYHVIIKTRAMEEEHKFRVLERQIREASTSVNKTGDSRNKEKIVYPSILVRTDYTGSKTTQDELAYYDEILYQLALWNAVDMRFRHISNPKIRLRIAGIIIGQDRKATPYFHNHMIDGVVQVTEAWPEMETYYANLSKRADFPKKAYDIIVTVTDLHMIGTTDDGVGAVIGMGKLGGLCVKSTDKYVAIAVFHDKGGFDGVLTAVHELGHVMGLDHDVKSGDDCDESHGYIMQPSDVYTPKNLEWSRCSLTALSQLLRERKCVKKAAKFHDPGPSVDRFLPGDIVKAHEQCQARGFSWACEPNPDTCTQMHCYYGWTWKFFEYGWGCINVGPAAEGTSCGPGHKCIDGACECMTGRCNFEIVE